MSTIINLADVLKLHDYITDKFRAGANEALILNMLNDRNVKLPGYLYDTSGEANVVDLQQIISEQVNGFKAKDYIRAIYTKNLYKPPGSKRVIMHDTDTDSVELTDIETVKLMTRGEAYLARLEVQHAEGYNPHNRLRTYMDKGRKFFNTYTPPTWKYAFWRYGTTVPHKDIPNIYVDFFTHLCDGDTDSINFLVDWLAISLQARNLTYLCTIGVSGVGKGTLDTIIQKLHGDENSVTLGTEALAKNFNKNFYGRTYIYLNELTTLSPAVLSKVKALNDSTTEIERKGIDSEIVSNHANYYFSSNDIQALPIDKFDRRYSIIQLTETKLTDVWPVSRFAELTDATNIEQLAGYLFNHVYNPRNVDTAFKKEHASIIAEANLSDWEIYLKEEFSQEYKGCAISLSHLAKYLQNAKGYRIKHQNLKKSVSSSIDGFSLRQKHPDNCTLYLNADEQSLTRDKNKSVKSIAVKTDVVYVKAVS